MATRTVNGAITLPKITLIGTLQRPPKISAAISLPPVTQNAGLTVQASRPLEASLGLPALVLSAKLARPAKIEAALALPGPTLTAAAKVLIRRAHRSAWALSLPCVTQHRSAWNMFARDVAAG